MAIALGIFAGTGMNVKAAGNWESIKFTPPSIGQGTSVPSGSYDALLSMCGDSWTSDELSELIGRLEENSVYIMSYYDNSLGNCLFAVYNTEEGCQFFSDSDYGNLLSLYKSSEYTYYILKKVSAPSTSGSGSDISSTSSTPHTHAYSWVTVQDVSSEQDGIEEYRCSCGDVQERCVIPRYMAIVKGLFGEIKNALQNGTATFDTGWLYTISDYVIKKLAERTDVTTVITFEYQNQAYKMTIPAGADFTGLLADEEYFYGYFFFANAVGATIEAIA